MTESAEKHLERVILNIRAADPALSGQEDLSAAEHERLARMHEGARPAFVTARRMLRASLGEYMGLLPGAIPLVQEGAGRVRIEGFSDNEPPFFSVSHTGAAEAGIAAVAVSETTPIGIDIQQLDPVMDWRRVAQRRFPSEDWALLANMSDEIGRMLFFTLWSIREAFVKMEDGKLMPYLRHVQVDLTARPPKLAAPTPGGREDAMIYFHFVPDHQLMIALVSADPVEIDLNCDIQPMERRPDPLLNAGDA
ncbi:4'-phosphopantetheinyl transferase family protein [Kordiimonas aestuarii]|uniref:4'-phosphopantetheinyl transferase family protein n=1 Tax=Kordiimonas aestuarii TaxID=1005925 RepID=UPI0021D23D1B|nr:4'-phosphopantetheinyl transferase superfamily protein [Kordiimonas aestuarii]